MLRPVILPQAFDCHPATWVHGLDNIAVRDVDPDVCNPWLIGVGKEDQVAWLQRVRIGDDSSILFTILIGGNTWKLEAELPVHILRKPAAIETGRISAAPCIRRADELRRKCGDVTSASVRR